MKTELVRGPQNDAEKKNSHRPKVDKIVIKHTYDEDPDMSHLGHYSNDCETPETIDRQERGDMGTNEYRYFVPANPEYAEEDYKRYEAYEKQEWHMFGVVAEALVSYQIYRNTSDRRLQRFTSGGLWGVESDAGESDLKEIEDEQLQDLRDHLARFEVDTSTWEELAAKAERKED